MKELSQKIRDLLASEPLRALKSKEIQRMLAVPQNKYSSLRSELRSLVVGGKLVKISKNRYTIARKANEIVGELRVNSQGYGFVTWEDGKDVFVSEKNMAMALHKDRVRVRLFAQTSGKSVEGQVVEVLERARKTVVGTFRWGSRYGYVVPDDLKLHKDIMVLSGDDMEAQEGQKVVCQIEQWEHHGLNPSGKIIEVLGFADDVGVDVLSIIHEHELPVQFPDAVLQQVEAIPLEIPREEPQRRLDLRDQIIFTIDPADAKDFDDAVSLEHLPDGGWALGVHIADVSYYVRENAPVDDSARERGTSVYLVDRVIPMLPERLSNELCSLVEGADRLTFSVLMTLSPDGQLISYDIKESIIRNKKRFSYKEAQQVIDGEIAHPYAAQLRLMAKLADLLIARRTRRGSIDFDSLEVEIRLNEKGEAVEILPRERLATNRLIEEFMLLANETAAKHVGQVLKEKLGYELPFVYRIHEKPDQQSVQQLIRMAAGFGVKVTAPQRLQPRFFANLSKTFQQHTAAHVLQTALLRTMMKAQYSTENIGHFGLAYHFYTHFTSPIRRYPDLLVHRLLKQYAAGGYDASVPAVKELDKLCKQATSCEIRAQEAERDSIKLKQLEFLQKHLEDEFDGIIVRMVNFGFFVELPDYLIDGLVHVTSLDDDYYVMDENNHRLEGRRNGRVFTLGDHVCVRLARIERNEKLVDFIICDNKPPEVKKAKRPTDNRRRKRAK
jgi:ribonuclease R